MSWFEWVQTVPVDLKIRESVFSDVQFTLNRYISRVIVPEAQYEKEKKKENINKKCQI